MNKIALYSLVLTLFPTRVPMAIAETDETTTAQEITVEKVGEYRPKSMADKAEAAALIVKQTNEFRKTKELSILTTNETLTQTAKEFAEYMARTGRYGHQADERTPAERAKDQKYDLCFIAENIAYQFRTTGFATAPLAERFVEGWKESPGHRKNMLREAVIETGVAIAQSETTGVYFAVQLFGRPKSAAIDFQVTNQGDREIRYRIGNRKFRLPSRFTRTHHQCQPGHLELLATSENSEGSKMVTKIKLRTQTKIIVTQGTDGTLETEIEEIEASELKLKSSENDSPK
ncbi:CAP domain-containing protein [Thalassoroseus pseudoceratinae]|uniref:CAP domain-containing protein n=1 Tax=Thalassoroseus pseudoceratinae TaxID=2713176 RepID=UPI0014248655|nr:CAP domain-containing protein [Thalassoroseus pseudoceratinae]